MNSTFISSTLSNTTRRSNCQAGTLVCLVLGWSALRSDGRYADMRFIYLAVCMAMLALWMLVTTSLWTAFLQAYQSLNKTDDLLEAVFHRHLERATDSFGYVIVALIILVVCGIGIAVLRGSYKSKLANDPLRRKLLGRLILNPILNAALFVAIVLIGLGAFLTVGRIYGEDLPFLSWAVPFVEGAATWTDAERYIRQLAFIVLPILGVAMYSRAESVAAALGVLRDVIVYSTRSYLRPAEAIQDNGKSNYPRRDRINARLDIVLKHFLSLRRYKSITIVSHSLGTVVAACVLEKNEALKPCPMFVTMGSPIGHIYNHYFRTDFDFVSKLKSTQKVAEWHNLFRDDDFVGTTVKYSDNMEWVIEEQSIPPRGHSGYWHDEKVIEYLGKRRVFD